MYHAKNSNSNGTPESLEARLRALPPLRVPADLEARLLAAIPVAVTFPRRRRRVWVRVVAASAAACLLAVLAWPRRAAEHQAGGLAAGDLVREGTTRLSASNSSASSSQKFQRAPEDMEKVTFTWPLEETSPLTVSSSIPGDLLE